MSKRPLGVYIHIPFCRSKCLYCAFNSVVEAGFSRKKWAGLLRRDFSGLIQREAISRDSHKLRSIYFGGGTPSLMPAEYIEGLISLVKDTFGVESSIEVTLEANPEGLGSAELEGFLQAGVNRLSLGVQSFNEEELKTLGRRHGAGEVISAVNGAVRGGFTNISLDLIFGIPGQTLQSWEETLNRLLAFNPAHISLYNLSIEENTPFYKLYHGNSSRGREKKTLIDETLESQMYELAINRLMERGYEHYEISNFARPAFKSLHNSGYWLGCDYIGLGPGAHSFFGGRGYGRRFWNEADLSGYEAKLKLGNPAVGSETLTRDEAMTEAVFLGLRMPERGIEAARFKGAFGEKAWQRLYGKCLEYEQGGLLHLSEQRVVLDKFALFTSNEVCLGLVS